MAQSGLDSSTDPNPYSPPPTGEQVDAAPILPSHPLPPMHWPRTIVMFLVLFVAGLATLGTTLPFAFAILFGGLRTALIYRGCSHAMRAPPSYLGSTIVGPILVFLFEIASGCAFFFICASRFSLHGSALSEQAWLVMTGIIALGIFAMLYVLSIRIAIAHCQPLVRPSASTTQSSVGNER